MAGSEDQDINAIRALIGRQFRSMSWTEGEVPDWAAFAGDFLPEAALYASARPARAQSVTQFTERMGGLVGTSLRSFEEKIVGSTIRVFGTVAVAVVACETVENAKDSNRTVEMMLLVKDAGAWRIAAQAWDKETPSNPITSTLCETE